mgnify:CR=1 FL=1
MIRAFEQRDMNPILNIWLGASLQAHAFIEAAYWQSHVDAMREVYIPASETYVFEDQSQVVGFYSLLERQLAALFVAPQFQGKGFGKQLVAHAKTMRTELSLAVYKENTASCQFYLAQGFVSVQEQVDEQTGHCEVLMVATRP